MCVRIVGHNTLLHFGQTFSMPSVCLRATIEVRPTASSLNSTGAVSSWYPRDIVAADTPDIRGIIARTSRMSDVSSDFPFQLATWLPDWSASGLLRCIVLPVCPCVVSFSKVHEPDTHDLLRTSR